MQTTWTGKFADFAIFSTTLDVGKGSCLDVSTLEETKD